MRLLVLIVFGFIVHVPAFAANRCVGTDLVSASQAQRRSSYLRDQLIPDARANLEQHTARCNREAAASISSGSTLAARVEAARLASEKAAALAQCNTRDRELNKQLDELVAECKALNC